MDLMGLGSQINQSIANWNELAKLYQWLHQFVDQYIYIINIFSNLNSIYNYVILSEIIGNYWFGSKYFTKYHDFEQKETFELLVPSILNCICEKELEMINKIDLDKKNYKNANNLIVCIDIMVETINLSELNYYSLYIYLFDI